MLFVHKDIHVNKTTFCTCIFLILILTVYSWLPTYLTRELKQSAAKSIMWIISAQLGQFAGLLVFGIAADRFGRRLTYTMFGGLMVVTTTVLAFFYNELLGSCNCLASKSPSSVFDSVSVQRMDGSFGSR